MGESISAKKIICKELVLATAVPFTNMEESGFMTYTAARHLGATETVLLHLGRAVRSSMFSTVIGLITTDQ